MYFGTDGIRAPVDSPKMNESFLYRLGLATTKAFGDHPQHFIVGRDTRESGPRLQAAFEQGLVDGGAIVEDVGVIPTPGIAYLSKHLEVTAGVMITASHNLYTDNGVKYFDGHGAKLSQAIQQNIETEIDKQSSLHATQTHTPKGKRVSNETAIFHYIEHCRQWMPEKVNTLTLVIDVANGAACDVAANLFPEAMLIHAEPDGRNINQGCGSTNMDSLKAAVLSHQADFGIAFDGDGDRVLCIDHAGEVVDGDEIVCLFAFSQSDCPGVVGTQMSNLGLEQALKDGNISFVRSAVGDRYVMEAMRARGWTLGGEASGHIIDLSRSSTGDGILTALQVIDCVLRESKSLHALKSGMIKRPQVLINVAVNNPSDWQKYPAILEAVAKHEAALGAEGRILIRPSGTEPLVRVMVEGNDLGRIQAIAESLATLVKTTVL